MAEKAREEFNGEVTTKLGRVSVDPRGEYSGEETYDRLDIVQFGGSGWICLADGTTGAEPTEGESWMRFADNGGAATVETAKGYAEAAKQSETAAKQSADAADASKTEAAQSASEAESAKTAASDSAERASGSAEEAKSSATAAGESSAAASGSAVEAQRSASAAAQSAVEAGEKADAAALSATEAETQATGAGASAGEAAQSALEAGTAKTEAVEARDEAQAASSTAASKAAEAAESAEKAVQYSGKPPKIGESGNWETWDAENGAYTDTGKPARGERGPAGPGSGDMTASVYDTHGKGVDIFDYADSAARSAAEKAVRDVSAGNVKFEDGSTFQEKLDSGELKGDRGETGPAGPAGEDGAPGEPGAPGTPGKDGAAGVSAGFGEPTAEVDGNTGVPSVTVTATGEDTEKVFHFAFTGLKGEPGAKGDKGEPGAPGKDGAAGTPGANGKDGAPGAVGPAGPNTVGTSTSTDIDGLLKGVDGKVAQAEAGVDYATVEQVNARALKPTVQTVKLTQSGWAGGTTQTVACTGIVTDEAKQIVSIDPAVGDFKAYCDAGCYVSGLDANKLVFTCGKTPEKDLTVYVSIQNVG